MMMNDPTEGLFYKIFDWIATVAILNVLWLLLTILGGVLFGWAPATVAVLAVWRQKARNTETMPIAKAMWQEYRTNFLTANGLGLILMLSGASLIFYSFTLVQWEGIFMLIFWMIFLMVAIIYIIVLVFIFPVYTHYKIKFWDYFKYAFAIGISHLHYVVMMVASIAVILWASGFFPAVFVAFTFSLVAMFITRMSLIVFDKIEDRQMTNGKEMKDE